MSENPALMNDALRNLLTSVCPKALPIIEFRASHADMPTAVWVALSLAVAVAMDAPLTPYLELLEDTLEEVA